jgi:hypothetical protein
VAGDRLVELTGGASDPKAWWMASVSAMSPSLVLVAWALRYPRLGAGRVLGVA